jgi:hypothetical protein
MKKILFIIILCQVHLIFAQSKKNQIEQLQFTADSLNRVIDFDRNSNKQKIQELNSAIVNFETRILNLGRSIDSLNSENRTLFNQLNLKSKELDRANNKLTDLNKINAHLQSQKDSLTKVLEKNFNYLDKLENGYSLTDVNGELGPKCANDLDIDGKEDLVIMLFNEDNQATIAIFLSSTFFKNSSYQTFEWLWTGNYLSDFICENNEVHLSGGSENQGLYSEITLKFDPLLGKMNVKNYEDSSGRNTFDELITKSIK